MNKFSEQDDMQNPDVAFINAVTKELDHSCDALDGHTVSRLNNIRHTAVEHKQSKAKALLFPFTGFVTACALVITITTFTQSGMGPQDSINASPLEDLEILSSSESLDFYEDYEFYQWLSENEASA